ncbi:MAG: class I SAM-dependent methyltransferase [Vicinamibacterales bacterium]|nr:class I SAM-dependent methyltransferase [Vicinamibacterales bacterium]
MHSSLLDWALHAAGLRAASTQTTPAERACLARHAAGRRALVEIGVMHGATTRLLCAAAAPEGQVTAVDPFPPGRLGVSFEYALSRREVARGRGARCRFMRETSAGALAGWGDPIDFLFIDADHSWEGIAHDWHGWTPFVVEGGLVALHDSRPIPDRTVYDTVRFTETVVLPDPAFTVVEAVDSLTVLRRVAPAAR